MYEVKRVESEQFEGVYNYQIIQGNNVLFLSFQGNLDFYMGALSLSDNQQEKICITIDRSNCTFYDLFYELFDEVENCKIFSNDEEKYELFDEEEKSEHIDRVNRMNEDLKKSSTFRRLYKNNLITWKSDNGDYGEPDYVRIYKGKDAFYLTFYRRSEELHMGTSVRFRNSGSSYDPFNIPFMRFFNKLQEYDPNFHQVHFDELEIERKLTKTLN